MSSMANAEAIANAARDAGRRMAEEMERRTIAAILSSTSLPSAQQLSNEDNSTMYVMYQDKIWTAAEWSSLEPDMRRYDSAYPGGSNAFFLFDGRMRHIRSFVATSSAPLPRTIHSVTPSGFRLSTVNPFTPEFTTLAQNATIEGVSTGYLTRPDVGIAEPVTDLAAVSQIIRPSISGNLDGVRLVLIVKTPSGSQIVLRSDSPIVEVVGRAGGRDLPVSQGELQRVNLSNHLARNMTVWAKILEYSDHVSAGTPGLTYSLRGQIEERSEILFAVGIVQGILSHITSNDINGHGYTFTLIKSSDYSTYAKAPIATHFISSRASCIRLVSEWASCSAEAVEALSGCLTARSEVVSTAFNSHLFKRRPFSRIGQDCGGDFSKEVYSDRMTRLVKLPMFSAKVRVIYGFAVLKNDKWYLDWYGRYIPIVRRGRFTASRSPSSTPEPAYKLASKQHLDAVNGTLIAMTVPTDPGDPVGHIVGMGGKYFDFREASVFSGVGGFFPSTRGGQNTHSRLKRYVAMSPRKGGFWGVFVGQQENSSEYHVSTRYGLRPLTCADNDALSLIPAGTVMGFAACGRLICVGNNPENWSDRVGTEISPNYFNSTNVALRTAGAALSNVPRLGNFGHRGLPVSSTIPLGSQIFWSRLRALQMNLLASNFATMPEGFSGSGYSDPVLFNWRSTDPMVTRYAFGNLWVPEQVISSEYVFESDGVETMQTTPGMSAVMEEDYLATMAGVNSGVPVTGAPDLTVPEGMAVRSVSETVRPRRGGPYRVYSDGWCIRGNRVWFQGREIQVVDRVSVDDSGRNHKTITLKISLIDGSGQPHEFKPRTTAERDNLLTRLTDRIKELEKELATRPATESASVPSL